MICPFCVLVRSFALTFCLTLTCLATPIVAQRTPPADKKIATQARMTGTSRLALLIGNGAYKGNLNSLKYPLHDVALMAKSLEAAQFTVTLLENADQEQMEKALSDFTRKVKEKRDSVAFVFYSGHGAQVAGQNYLIPILDRLITDESSLKFRTISLSEMLSHLDESGCPLKIVVLDACRNDPFKGLSIIRIFRCMWNNLLSHAGEVPWNSPKVSNPC